MAERYRRETLRDIQAGQALALRAHNEVFVPADASLAVRIFAIAVLAAELAVTNSETIEEAAEIVDTIFDNARSALASGFAKRRAAAPNRSDTIDPHPAASS